MSVQHVRGSRRVFGGSQHVFCWTRWRVPLNFLGLKLAKSNNGQERGSHMQTPSPRFSKLDVLSKTEFAPHPKLDDLKIGIGRFGNLTPTSVNLRALSPKAPTSNFHAGIGVATDGSCPIDLCLFGIYLGRFPECAHSWRGHGAHAGFRVSTEPATVLAGSIWGSLSVPVHRAWQVQDCLHGC